MEACTDALSVPTLPIKCVCEARRGVETLHNLHGHDGVGLGLDLGDTLDALELGDEGLLGLELGLLPLTEGIGGQGDNNLEVEASTADNALQFDGNASQLLPLQW